MRGGLASCPTLRQVRSRSFRSGLQEGRQHSSMSCASRNSPAVWLRGRCPGPPRAATRSCRWRRTYWVRTERVPSRCRYWRTVRGRIPIPFFVARACTRDRVQEVRVGRTDGLRTTGERDPTRTTCIYICPCEVLRYFANWQHRPSCTARNPPEGTSPNKFSGAPGPENCGTVVVRPGSGLGSTGRRVRVVLVEQFLDAAQGSENAGGFVGDEYLVGITL